MATYNSLYFFGGFNDYFNRIVKRYDFYNLYVLESANSEYIQNYNFNPNDDINAEIIINHSYNWTPNYLLVMTKPDAETPDEIVSRWFVVETQRTRGGQYRFILLRDVMADFYEEIVNATTFVEKAKLSEANPLLYNSENFLVNQIKKEEVLLKDETQIPWIVGYVSRTTINPISVPYTAHTDFASIQQYKDKYGITLNTSTAVLATSAVRTDISLYTKHNQVSQRTIHARLDGNFNFAETYVGAYESSASYNLYGDDTQIRPNEIANKLALYMQDATNEANIRNVFKASETNNLDLADFNALCQTNGMTIRDGDNVYRIRIQIGSTGAYKSVSYNSSIGIELSHACEYLVDNFDFVYFNELANFNYYLEGSTATIILEQVQIGSYDVNISTSRQRLNDAPYDMFALPYGSIYLNDGTRTFNTSEFISNLIAQQIGNDGGGTANWLYDLQLLPYCPIKGLVGSNRTIDLTTRTSGVDYDLITFTYDETTVNVGAIFWASKSSDTFRINFTRTVQEPKVENECDMYRLVSPNYNGIFEFNLAKMRGINYIDVDFTYKPFNPYIHLNPNFSFLYGQDFNDARGLICGGDFSIAINSEAWKQFEVQNKNYQTIFDRQIQNLEFQQSQQWIQGGVQAVGGAIGGAAGGAIVGGVPGAIVGGVIGTIGGVADLAMMGAKQREEKDYTIDMYKLNLRNIKAQPNSFVKSSALSANNKLFPFIEYYSCTDEEKEAFRRKIEYNGMTVGAIGKISDYLWENLTYIKGQLIRINLDGDTHIVNKIYEELNKGVYIKLEDV